MIKPIKNRKGEWPIVRFWYTKNKGMSIEELIEKKLDYFEWAVNTFQNITPDQALYYYKKTKNKVPSSVVQDVTPYEHQKGDPESMYEELCETQNLEGVIIKYRGVNLELF